MAVHLGLQVVYELLKLLDLYAGLVLLSLVVDRGVGQFVSKIFQFFVFTWKSYERQMQFQYLLG